MTTNLGKDINLIVYNYIHCDLMKYVVTQYKKSVRLFCDNNECECEGNGTGVCNCWVVYGTSQIEYNYRYLGRRYINDYIFDINGKATKHEVPPKYYYSL